MFAQKSQTELKLNVGGHKVSVSKELLCSAPESALEAMFSGRHALNL